MPSLNRGVPPAPPMGQVMTNRGAAVAVAGTAGGATGAGVVVEGATAWLAVVCVAWGARVLPNAAIARPAPRTATATGRLARCGTRARRRRPRYPPAARPTSPSVIAAAPTPLASATRTTRRVSRVA